MTWGDHDAAHQNLRAGAISLGILETTKDVVFDPPMPDDAVYEVFLQPRSGISVSFWPSGFTPAGFTLNVSLGALATFSYLAVEKLR
jgi:hypothetical protein